MATTELAATTDLTGDQKLGGVEGIPSSTGGQSDSSTGAPPFSIAAAVAPPFLVLELLLLRWRPSLPRQQRPRHHPLPCTPTSTRRTETSARMSCSGFHRGSALLQWILAASARAPSPHLSPNSSTEQPNMKLVLCLC